MTEPRPAAWNDLARAVPGVEMLAPYRPDFEPILDPRVLRLVAAVERRFRDQRHFLLLREGAVAERWLRGCRLDFLPETAPVRESDWQIDPLPDDLVDRKVELVVPATAELVDLGRRTQASLVVADLEDGLPPSFENLVAGHRAIAELARLGDRPLAIRPRGLAVVEPHLLVDGLPISAALFDVAVFSGLAATRLAGRGSGPYVYLPKLGSHLEARFWHVVFAHLEDELGLPRGSYRATALIETVPAAFEMDEILYQLREHAAGLALGPHDYHNSFLRGLQDRATWIGAAPNAAGQPFVHAAAELLVQTCHRRGAPAIGTAGARWAASPDPLVAEITVGAFGQAAERAVREGYDGFWVFEPGYVEVARRAFDRFLDAPNQIDRQRDDVVVVGSDLLRARQASPADGELLDAAADAVAVISAWRENRGRVLRDGRYLDLACAETARSALWRWLRGRLRSKPLRGSIAALLDRIETPAGREVEAALRLFAETLQDEDPADSLGARLRRDLVRHR